MTTKREYEAMVRHPGKRDGNWIARDLDKLLRGRFKSERAARGAL